MAERDRLGGGDDQQQQQQGSAEKLAQDAGNFFRGLVGKAKKEVEKIDTKPLEQGAQRFQEEAQRAGQQLSDKYKGADGKFDPSKLAKDAAPYAIPGVGQAKLAQDLIGKGGGGNIIDKIGGLFNKGNEEITRLDAMGFAEAVATNFDTLDRDKNGFINKEEILAAKADVKFRIPNAFMLKRLEDDYDNLRVLNNDEWFRETTGIAKGDIAALAMAKANGTGFGATTDAMLSSANDLKYVALIGGGATGAANWKAVGSGKALGRAALVGAGIAAASAIYGGADYLLFRKGSLEDQLKKFEQ